MILKGKCTHMHIEFLSHSKVSLSFLSGTYDLCIYLMSA